MLEIALEVLATHGIDFTLSALARRVGLSHATLIQRFGDRDAILRRMAAHEVAATRSRLACVAVEPGPDGLWRFLDLIVGSMGSGAGFSARVQIAAFEARDPVLRGFAAERYAIVQDSIAARLPDGMERSATAEHLHAVNVGATMQWVASDRESGLSDHVLARVRWALDRMDPGLIGGEINLQPSCRLEMGGAPCIAGNCWSAPLGSDGCQTSSPARLMARLRGGRRGCRGRDRQETRGQPGYEARNPGPQPAG